MSRILILLLGCTISMLGQSDSLRTDSVQTVKSSWIQADTSASFITYSTQKILAYYQSDQNLPDPKTAVWLSAAMPGMGQVYNKQAWKLPVVYGGFGLALYNLGNNQSLYRRFRVAYEKDIAGEEREFPQLNRGSLRDYRDSFRRQVELNYMGLGGIYILTILDAFVSAHLSSFDVSDDLTIHMLPAPEIYGLQMSMIFKF